jgi:hypothetical protein
MTPSRFDGAGVTGIIHTEQGSSIDLRWHWSLAAFTCLVSSGAGWMNITNSFLVRCRFSNTVGSSAEPMYMGRPWGLHVPQVGTGVFSHCLSLARFGLWGGNEGSEGEVPLGLSVVPCILHFCLHIYLFSSQGELGRQRGLGTWLIVFHAALFTKMYAASISLWDGLSQDLNLMVHLSREVCTIIVDMSAMWQPIHLGLKMLCQIDFTGGGC